MNKYSLLTFATLIVGLHVPGVGAEASIVLTAQKQTVPAMQGPPKLVGPNYLHNTTIDGARRAQPRVRTGENAVEYSSP